MPLVDDLTAITNDYFIINGGKAADNYFLSSFLMDYFFKQKKGIWKRPGSGNKIRIPFRFDGADAVFYARGATATRTDKPQITAAYFDWKHAASTAKSLRVDRLKNEGPEGLISQTMELLYGAQESLSTLLAKQFYNGAGVVAANPEYLTGMRHMCDNDATVLYGNVTENEAVAADGTKVWKGNSVAATAGATHITLDLIRQRKSDAWFGKGRTDEPDLGVLPKLLYNEILDQLQIQQRFTSASAKVSKPVAAGFIGVHFEGTDLFPDRYISDGPGDTFMFLINSAHFGVAVHKNGLFERTKWKAVDGSHEDKWMEIFFDGNLVADNRRAHICVSALTPA